MPRPRSLIVSMEITVAGNSHNCRNNNSHRISKGMKRLTINSDGEKHHYCLVCARAFLVKDLDRMREVFIEVEGGLQASSG
jgi:hypothetical protein